MIRHTAFAICPSAVFLVRGDFLDCEVKCGVREVEVQTARTLGSKEWAKTLTTHSLLVVVLLAIFPMLTCSQADPLSPAYLPAMDTKSADYPANVWMTNSLQKVRQDSGAPGSQHWGISYGTQNEFVDFQVHVQAPVGGYPALYVTSSDFINARAGTHISAASTNIVVYREAYVHVQIYPTNDQSDSAVPGGANYNTFYGGALGYYPDILIPAVDPYWHQITNAWPFGVLAGQNQSAWVDVLIPSSAPSGYYFGNVTVTNGTSMIAVMPVIITVWQWPNSGLMPSTPSLTANLESWQYDGLCTQMYAPAYSGNFSCAGYPGSRGDSDAGVTETWLDASLLVKDHRYNMGVQQNIFPGGGSFATWDAYVGPLMNGTCNLHGGAGTTCPLLTGSRQTTKSIDFLSSATSAVWMNCQANFAANAWGTFGKLPLFDALIDEPHTVPQFPWAVANAVARHGFTSPGIPEMVTSDIFFGQGSQSAANSFSTTTCGSTNCIQNAIDILVPAINVLEPAGGPIQPLASYKTWLAGSTDQISRYWWSYEACSSAGTCSAGVPGPPAGVPYVGWPNYMVDGKPAAHRAMEWLTFLHGQTGELYYAADFCNSQTYRSSCVPDSVPWDPWNGSYFAGGWGNGTLVYPGGIKAGAINYMGPGVTIPIILPSVRLKDIRDGVQDYDYLNALTNAGKGALVQTQIARWITNSYTLETSGAGLQTARMALGKALHQLTYPNRLQPPTNPTGQILIFGLI